MTDWTEVHFSPHGMRYRWRWDAVNADGYLKGLELERWRGEIEEWVPVSNYDTKDWFRMGFIAASKAGGQVEMGL